MNNEYKVNVFCTDNILSLQLLTGRKKMFHLDFTGLEKAFNEGYMRKVINIARQLHVL
jgi:hypothetical protein